MLAKVKLSLTAKKVHSVRYDATSDQRQPAITTLYVANTALPVLAPPKVIVVTIEAEEEEGS